MNHPGQFDVNRPLERTVHLRGYVIPLRRLPGGFQFLHRFDFCDPGDRIDIGPGQCDVEFLSCNQVPYVTRFDASLFAVITALLTVS